MTRTLKITKSMYQAHATEALAMTEGFPISAQHTFQPMQQKKMLKNTIAATMTTSTLSLQDGNTGFIGESLTE